MGALVVLAAVLLVGCGGSSGSSSSEESSTASSGQAGGPAAFEISDETRACLKEQGVELPEPGEGGPQPVVRLKADRPKEDRLRASAKAGQR